MKTIISLFLIISVVLTCTTVLAGITDEWGNTCVVLVKEGKIVDVDKLLRTQAQYKGCDVYAIDESVYDEMRAKLLAKISLASYLSQLQELPKTLNEELAELKAKVAELEAR